jgi:hypothetical protein
VVGTDPLLLHFDVDPAAQVDPVAEVQWSSLGSLERLTLQSAPKIKPGLTTFQSVTVAVSRVRADLDPLSGKTRPVRVGKASGSLALADGAGQLRWQPLPGVWAEVQASGDEAQLVKLASGVRFDRVLRCVVPFRLSWVPAGSTVDSCSVLFSSDRVTGSATIRVPNGGYVTVSAEPDGKTRAGNTVIGGRPALVREYPGDAKALIFQIDIDWADHVVDLLAEGRYDKSVVLQVAQGYREITGADPAAWLANPLG